MRLATEVGDRWVVAVGHHNLGNALVGLGEHGAAGPEFLHALRAYEDYGDHWSLALLAEDMVLMALAKGQREQAVELLGATDALRERIDAPRTPAVTAALDAAFAGSADESAPTTDPSYARGRALDDDAVSELLRDAGRSPAPRGVEVK
jgi:hypothetical protein